MKKIFAGIVVGVASLAATACTPTQEGAAIGAGTGALIGTAIDGGGLGGALVGGAIGAGAGALVGRAVENQPGKCYYRDRYGREYTDDCPPGYR